MQRVRDAWIDEFASRGWDPVLPEVVQALSERELIALVPKADGWIAGDDPVSRLVLDAGSRGRLRAVVKWGVGVDNVDFQAANELGVPVASTPGAFAHEVADLALGYIIALARETFPIDRAVRQGLWPKPTGLSLAGRTVAIVGLGSIGRQVARRVAFLGMKVIAYDPHVPSPAPADVSFASWPDRLEEADFLVIACPLTRDTRHLVDAASLAHARRGLRIVNVSRGAVIREEDLAEALASRHVHGAALDVFEQEPLPDASPLRNSTHCVFGSHNASNTGEGAVAASREAIARLAESLARQETRA